MKLKDLLAAQIHNNIEQVLQEKYKSEATQNMFRGNYQHEQENFDNGYGEYQGDGLLAENYNYEGEEQNPLEATTKINEDSNNTTALHFLNQFNSNTLYSKKPSRQELFAGQVVSNSHL